MGEKRKELLEALHTMGKALVTPQYDMLRATAIKVGAATLTHSITRIISFSLSLTHTQTDTHTLSLSLSLTIYLSIYLYIFVFSNKLFHKPAVFLGCPACSGALHRQAREQAPWERLHHVG
jgi:hypothetical protein